MKTTWEETLQNVRQLFFKQYEWTKNDIALETHYSLGTITHCLQELEKEGTICYIKDASSTGGRKSKIYSLNKDYQHMGYLLLQKNKEDYFIKVYRVNLFNEILDEKTYSVKGCLQDLKDILQQIKKDPLVQLFVISIPGIVSNGYVEVCDFELLENIDLKKEIEAHMIIENDVNIGAIGFSYDYPQVNDLGLIYQPNNDYSGCGLIINHKLYNGFSHKAGELRYLPLLDEKKQTQMLKEDPQTLLLIQIQILKSVLDLELIGIYSEAFNVKKELLPQGVIEVELSKCLFKGLYKIAMKQLGGIKDEKLY